MKDPDKIIFINLFKEACEKCFGFPLTAPLSEADCKHFSNDIFSRTGLVIGAKSIKNYSFYVYNAESINSRKENPSTATLDTLARYVLNAPYTDEIRRKNNESHYPYWFQYRSRFSGSISIPKAPPVNLRKLSIGLIAVISIAAGILVIISLIWRNSNENFTDNFNSVLADSLTRRGWMIRSLDTAWWTRRSEKPGHLALFTLKGDNWGNEDNPACIKNLLTRKISSDCFMVEIHLTNFIPFHNWQQAGILLSEDSTFKSKALRLSLSYNDFFGGYMKPPEIIIQVVSSSESGNQSKPEEIAHVLLFSIEKGNEGLVENNLAKSALKIEKKGSKFRFLYTTSSMESFAFKEAVSGTYNIEPKYISLFAIRGWSDTGDNMPAYFDSFSYATISCDK